MPTSRWPEFVAPGSGEPLRVSPDALVARYPMVNAIPCFVQEGTYAEHFGWQWNRFPKTQLNSYTKLPIAEDRMHEVHTVN